VNYNTKANFLWSQIPQYSFAPTNCAFNLNVNQQKINYPKIEADEIVATNQNQIIQTNNDEV